MGEWVVRLLHASIRINSGRYPTLSTEIFHLITHSSWEHHYPLTEQTSVKLFRQIFLDGYNSLITTLPLSQIFCQYLCLISTSWPTMSSLFHLCSSNFLVWRDGQMVRIHTALVEKPSSVLSVSLNKIQVIPCFLGPQAPALLC